MRALMCCPVSRRTLPRKQTSHSSRVRTLGGGGRGLRAGRGAQPIRRPVSRGPTHLLRQVFRLGALNRSPSRRMTKNVVRQWLPILKSAERSSLPVTAARPRWIFTTLPYSPGFSNSPGTFNERTVPGHAYRSKWMKKGMTVGAPLVDSYPPAGLGDTKNV